jgi:hypothetical protein
MTFFGGLAGFAVDAMARPAIRIRAASGNYDERGVWVPSSGPVSENIRAVIQDPKEADIRQLPEGERVEAFVAIWTRAELRTSDETANTEADRVVSEHGDTYKITRVSDRAEGGFYRAIARLEHARGRGIR